MREILSRRIARSAPRIDDPAKGWTGEARWEPVRPAARRRPWLLDLRDRPGSAGQKTPRRDHPGGDSISERTRSVSLEADASSEAQHAGVLDRQDVSDRADR